MTTSHEAKLKQLFAALATPNTRPAFGRWFREQRLDANMTQSQVAAILGNVQGQSLSRVESGVFRLSYPKLARLFQPWQDYDWHWRWEGDVSEPETLALVTERADPALIFDPARSERYQALAQDGTHTMKSHGMPDPTTALLLTQWEKLDSRDRAMVLSVVLRLAEAEQAGSAPKKYKDK